MKKIIFALILIFILALGDSSAKADSWSFATIPANGEISGAPGETIGWGFSIANSTNNFLAVSSIGNGIWSSYVTNINPLILFPIVDPFDNLTVNYSYNSLGSTGLYEITWTNDAPIGWQERPDINNKWVFIISVDFYTDSDLKNYVGSDSITVPYLATVTSPVPEPATLVLMCFGSSFMGIGIKRLRKKLRKTK
jgi:hypothetical protein